MGNDKIISAKTTVTDLAKTTVDPVKTTLTLKTPAPAATPIDPTKATATVEADKGAIKTTSNTIESTSLPVKQESDLIQNFGMPGTDKKAKSPEATASTKMDIATEIYKRMWKVKDVTRKEILEQFVVEAKLSKAGASTYYQLIKAKVK